MKKKLAIVTTHPIQYYAPLFRQLAESTTVQPRVFYTWSQTANGKAYSQGLRTEHQWDIPLLEGYEYEFVPNVARRPGSYHFFGIRNPTLIRTIASWRPDAVLVYGWNTYSHLRALMHFKNRVPVLFRGDSTLVNRQSAARSIVRRAILQCVYRNVDTAIAVGQNNRDYFAWSGVPENRIKFAPHSVDTNRFSDPSGVHDARAATLRAELGLSNDDIVLVFAGKFIPEKDPVLLIEAFLRSNTDAHLIMVGNGPLEDAAKAAAGSSTKIHFLPFQNQSTMPTVYRLGDIFILPSRSETWGLALNEALACGRPVIAGSNVGAARDLIETGTTGWTFKSGDAADLTRLVQKVLTLDRSELRTMGNKCKEACSAWSIEETARRMAAIINDQS